MIARHRPSLVSRIRAGSPCTTERPSNWLDYLDLDHLAVTAGQKSRVNMITSNTAAATMINLNGGKDGRDIICRAPPILQDIQTDATICVNIRVKHFWHKTNCRWLVWVFLGEFDSQLESSILEWCVMRSVVITKTKLIVEHSLVSIIVLTQKWLHSKSWYCYLSEHH